MSVTREQDFREVRRLLGDPSAQSPTPDMIVSNMISAEQYLMNRMTGTGKPWTHNTLTVTSVAGQAVYDLDPSAGPVQRQLATFGKTLFVYRDLGNGVILPIPATDFLAEIQAPKYEFWVASLPGEFVTSYEQVATYRDGNGVYLRIYPEPTEAREYIVVYATGNVDWNSFEWDDLPVLQEFSRYRQLYAALATLAKCRWDGNTKQEDAAYRQELRADLRAEMALHEPELTSFLRNPNHEPSISEVGYYWE